MTQRPSPSSKPRQVKIEVPPDLEGTYANFVMIAHSPSEIVLDFARVMPGLPKARVHTRIIMTPLNAKLLLRALNENLARYEAQFGEIYIPEAGAALADQLFNFPPTPPEGS
ncbi:MAG TPA: DUF3467 domain-containing protein [Chloroflexi bacterium]|nr:DUF3467 domain-containing protein [Chloroflexota bacterium]